MSNKYCPAGKIECENCTGDSSVGVIQCVIHPIYKHPIQQVNDFEQCPWPSKQKKIVVKYDKAWEMFENFRRASVTITRIDFWGILKDAGL